jgi:hypothetical protein
MEKEFIDLVNHVFTLHWASWALPVSILAALVVKRFIPVLLISVLAVVIQHVGPVVLPALLGGESMSTIINDINTMIPTLEPISLLAEYIAYVYMIFVFSLQRRDMFRPGVTE